MKLLALGAHPDDIEFGCGGLMIKEAQKGTQIMYVICSLGESGTNGTPEDRKKEAEDAAKLVGADVTFLNLGGDCHIINSPENAYKIAKIIREFKPDLVLSPQTVPHQHPDHLAVGQLGYNACRFSRYGGIEELKDLPAHRVSFLYQYAIYSEVGLGPDILIDVSSVHEAWEQAMSLHVSQMKTKSYLDLVNSKAKYYGKSIGVEYAIGLWKTDPIRIDTLSDLTMSSRNY